MRTKVGLTWRAVALGSLLATAGVWACNDSTTPTPRVDKVLVTPATGALEVGQTIQLDATVQDASGAALERTIIWSSSDLAKASVSTTGLVTAVGSGEVTISATAESRSGSAVIQIDVPVAMVELAPPAANLELDIGDTLRVTSVVKDPQGTGEWDFGAGGSASVPLGPLVVGVDATKWWLGDMPGLTIKDPVTYGASVTHYLATNSYSVFGTFWGATKTFEDTEAPRQVGIGGCRMYRGACALGLTVSAGLSSASPDLSVGMSWQVPLGR